MAKPKRGGQRGSTGVLQSVAEVITQSGDKADLSKSPLRYGSKDSTMSPDVRATIEDFEKRHRKHKIEYGMLVDADGNILQEKRGGRNSVALYTYFYRRAEAYTHVHPRGKGEEGYIGGSFSKEDLDAFSEFPNLKTMRAAAAEGLYTISKGSNFDRTGFETWQADVEKRCRSDYRDNVNALSKQYFSSGMTYSEFKKQEATLFNEFLVAKHNEYLAG